MERGFWTSNHFWLIQNKNCKQSLQSAANKSLRQLETHSRQTEDLFWTSSFRLRDYLQGIRSMQATLQLVSMMGCAQHKQPPLPG
jgi:hypothetical protein